MRDDDGSKYLSVGQLYLLITKLPLPWHVMPNAVGNLAVLDENLKQVGHIDFMFDGKVVLYDSLL